MADSGKESVGTNNGHNEKANGNVAQPERLEFSHRLQRLVKKDVNRAALKHKVWLSGHSACAVFGILYFLCRVLRIRNRFYMVSIIYEISLFGAIAALTMTLSHEFGMNSLPSLSVLATQQNLQYLFLGIVWVFSFESILKLIPYVLISILQLARYKNITAINKVLGDVAMVVAHSELVVILYLFLRTIVFRGASGFQLVAFLVFYWLRILFNKETKNLLNSLINLLDDKVQSVNNPKVQKAWTKIKMLLKEKKQEVEEN